MNLFQTNLSFLSSKNELLYTKVVEASADLQLIASQSDLSAFTDTECIYDNFLSSASKHVSDQLANGRTVSISRLYAQHHNLTFLEVLRESVDNHTALLTTSLPNLQKKENETLLPPISRDLCLLGSYNLIGLAAASVQSESFKHLRSITLLESSFLDLAVMLHTLDLEAFAKQCKQNDIIFHLMCEESYIALRESYFLGYLAMHTGAALHGLKVISPLRDNPDLIELSAWMFSHSGIASRVKAYLGSTIDELNQVYQSVYGHISLGTNKSLIGCNSAFSQLPVIITGSGPSLDDYLEQISLASNKNIPIIAAGSSLGSLLRHNIHVDIVVLLERDSAVSTALQELIDENYLLNDTILICSCTVSPYVTSKFKEVRFFHRPSSSTAALFSNEYQYSLKNGGPESLNAALEVGIHLGFKNILLFGADFAASSRKTVRSKNAIGNTPRSFHQPIRGNKGKTVFSEPSLLLARDSFASVLYMCSEVTCYRFGEGAEILGTQSVSDSFMDSYLADYNVDIQKYPSYTFVDSLVTIDQLELRLCNVKIYLKKILNEVIQQISSRSSWDKDFHILMSKLFYLYQRDDTVSLEELCALRLLRESLFNLSAPLYDCVSDEQWGIESTNAIYSLNYLLNFVNAYLSSMISLVRDKDISYQWSRDNVADHILSCVDLPDD